MSGKLRCRLRVFSDRAKRFHVFRAWTCLSPLQCLLVTDALPVTPKQQNQWHWPTKLLLVQEPVESKLLSFNVTANLSHWDTRQHLTKCAISTHRGWTKDTLTKSELIQKAGRIIGRRDPCSHIDRKYGDNDRRSLDRSQLCHTWRKNGVMAEYDVRVSFRVIITGNHLWCEGRTKPSDLSTYSPTSLSILNRSLHKSMKCRQPSSHTVSARTCGSHDLKIWCAENA